MTGSPRIIFWETTKRCNLRCAYCRVLKNGSQSELNTGEAMGLVSDIKGSFPDALLILSGGESFLREDLFDILSHTSTLGLKTSLATNGTLLGREEAEKLKKTGVKRVSISLDSSTEAYHDRSRGIPGSYKKALDGARALKDNGIPIQINFTVAKSNMREITDIAKLSHSLGAEALHYFIMVATGCGKKLEETEVLDAGCMDEALRAIKEVSRDIPMEIRSTCAPQYVRYTEKGAGGPALRSREVAGKLHGAGGCLAGTGVFFVSSEGDIYPCGYLPVKAGSLRERSIYDIWKDSPVFTTLRQNKFKGGCASCAHKNTCRGCRARAYSRTGDYMGADDTCSLPEKLVSI